MQRVFGIIAGIATQALFLATVPVLYCFLRNDFSASTSGSLWVDAALAAHFSVLHSLLLWPPVRGYLGRWIGKSFYGSFYCVVTCASLWLMFATWRGSSVVLFAWPTVLQPTVRVAFWIAWGALFYSLNLTGLGYQTGLTPWWYWLRRQPLPARRFQPKGAYHWLRHPVYLSFLGLVWLTPVVTADRAVLIGIWTVYIFVGSCLKDERMAFYLGEPYREYLTSVPGYPFFPWGPLSLRTPQTPAILPLPQNQKNECPRKAA